VLCGTPARPSRCRPCIRAHATPQQADSSAATEELGRLTIAKAELERKLAAAEKELDGLKSNGRSSEAQLRAQQKVRWGGGAGVLHVALCALHVFCVR
jgi:hypothetical protein